MASNKNAPQLKATMSKMPVADPNFREDFHLDIRKENPMVPKGYSTNEMKSLK